MDGVMRQAGAVAGGFATLSHILTFFGIVVGLSHFVATLRGGQGDSEHYVVAAASVLAKVTRDRLMAEYDK